MITIPAEQYGFGYDLMAQYFVAKGYTYLAPNYRGSTGYGLDYEHANYNNWGVGDTQDCLYGTKYMRTLPGVDPQRIGIMGGSYGGYMVACCLSRDPEYLFACGVSRYGDANLVSSWAQCDPSTRLYTEMQITRPALNRQVYIDGSPIHQAENIQKPVLILHGLRNGSKLYVARERLSNTKLSQESRTVFKSAPPSLRRWNAQNAFWTGI